MARPQLSDGVIRRHVEKLGEEHPPIALASADFTLRDPAGVRERWGHVLDYLARVELEVDRNVLELLVLLPEVSETDRLFYADVWQPQEIQHGVLLDQLQAEIDMPPAQPQMEVQLGMKLLGALAHRPAIGEIARILYYLTGAATERSAVLAYNRLVDGLEEMGETAVSRTIIGQIKRQEPGHFAFYRMSAELMRQDGSMRPWQWFLARVLRAPSFEPVGVIGRRVHRRQFGGVMQSLGFSDDLPRFVRDIARVETQVLWAHRQGMEFPRYVLDSFLDALRAFERHGWPDLGARPAVT